MEKDIELEEDTSMFEPPKKKGMYARMIEDSISEDAIRICTIEARAPRIILAEQNTHRNLSRNTSSSRAIPIQKLVRDVRNDMFVPTFWGKNQRGMQAKEELTGWRRWLAEKVWRFAGHTACNLALLLSAIGLHKQYANRLIEPFSYVTICITSTYWANYIALRNHPDAQPEIKILAGLIEHELLTSIPKKVKYGEWHLPYTTPNEKYWYKGDGLIEDLKKISIARCASTSYKTVDGKAMTHSRAKLLADKLLSAVPVHASPAEHQATPDRIIDGKWEHPEQHGNLIGWCQLRKRELPGEFVNEYKDLNVIR